MPSVHQLASVPHYHLQGLKLTANLVQPTTFVPPVRPWPLIAPPLPNRLQLASASELAATASDHELKVPLAPFQHSCTNSTLEPSSLTEDPPLGLRHSVNSFSAHNAAKAFQHC